MRSSAKRDALLKQGIQKGSSIYFCILNPSIPIARASISATCGCVVQQSGLIHGNRIYCIFRTGPFNWYVNIQWNDFHIQFIGSDHLLGVICFSESLITILVCSIYWEWMSDCCLTWKINFADVSWHKLVIFDEMMMMCCIQELYIVIKYTLEDQTKMDNPEKLEHMVHNT